MWKNLKEAAGNTLNFARWVLLVLIAIYLLRGFYTIKSDELGILERLGKVVDRAVTPGLHYSPPWPFSKVYKVPVKKVKRILINDFYQDPAPNSRSSIFYNLTGLESYCLSGDNNAVEIQTVVQYTASDPFDYLFGTSGGDVLLRDIVSREIIQALTVRPVDAILTYGKKEIEGLLHRRVQKKLDANRTGLMISAVEIKEIRPPSGVQEYFDDVINAKVDKKKMISRAESYRNEEIPQARAQADRSRKEAEAYRDEVIAAAQGESSRFLDKLEEYAKAPGVTRKRLYLEFARETLNRLNNVYLLDEKGGEVPVHLRLLSLD